jgi:hypothetical protein
VIDERANWAMSQPAFVPERGEIWYSDGTSGFYALKVDADVWPSSTAAGSTCLARRSPIGPRNIGRVRLGFTRSRLRRVPVRLVRTTRRSDRFCVKKSSRRVSAVFSRRGRAVLVVTTARGHGNRRVRPGVSARRFRRAYPRRRRIARGLYRANPRSRRLIGVRRGRVRFWAVVDRGVLRNRSALRRYLRLAGVR